MTKKKTMEVSKIQIFPIKKGKTLKAYVQLTIDDVLVIKGFKVVEGKKGLFVTKPSSKGSDDNYYDDVYFLDQDIWSDIQDMIMEEYEREVN